MRWRPGLRPGPRWGGLQRSPDPLAGLRGPTSKGREGEREGREEDGKGRGGKGRGGENGRGGAGRGGEEREMPSVSEILKTPLASMRFVGY